MVNVSKAQENTCCSQFIRFTVNFFSLFKPSTLLLFLFCSFSPIFCSSIQHSWYLLYIVFGCGDFTTFVHELWVWEKERVLVVWSEQTWKTTKFEELCVCRSMEFVRATCLLSSDIWKQWNSWIRPINSLQWFFKQLRRNVFLEIFFHFFFFIFCFRVFHFRILAHNKNVFL